MKQFKTFAPILGVVVLIVALFVWGVMTKGPSATVFVPGTNVACLPNGHQNLADHIHPTLTITVDGVPEAVPPGIGITPTCMAETHTHEGDGVIHVETVTQGRLAELTFADFLLVANMPLLREGMSVTLTVDDAIVTDPASVHFEDGQKIVIAYTSIVE